MKPKDGYRREHVRYMVLGPNGTIYWFQDNGLHDAEEYLKQGWRVIKETTLHEEMEL